MSKNVFANRNWKFYIARHFQILYENNTNINRNSTMNGALAVKPVTSHFDFWVHKLTLSLTGQLRSRVFSRVFGYQGL